MAVNAARGKVLRRRASVLAVAALTANFLAAVPMAAHADTPEIGRAHV